MARRLVGSASKLSAQLDPGRADLDAGRLQLVADLDTGSAQLGLELAEVVVETVRCRALVPTLLGLVVHATTIPPGIDIPLSM